MLPNGNGVQAQNAVLVQTSRQEYQKQILKGCCQDKDEASDAFADSHNPAIIITPDANVEQVGNYSRASFTLLVLPDLGLKRNSARLHRKYRAKPHRRALSKGLCWLWGQNLGRALQEKSSPSHGLYPSGGEGVGEAALLPWAFKPGDKAAL